MNEMWLILKMTFVSDNASDIRKALSVKGQFNSLGCAAAAVVVAGCVWCCCFAAAAAAAGAVAGVSKLFVHVRPITWALLKYADVKVLVQFSRPNLNTS